MSRDTFKAVCLVNIAKRLTGLLRCLSGTGLSQNHSKSLRWILLNTNLSRKVTDLSCLVIDHLTRFLILIPIKSKEAAVVVRHLSLSVI